MAGRVGPHPGAEDPAAHRSQGAHALITPDRRAETATPPEESLTILPPARIASHAEEANLAKAAGSQRASFLRALPAGAFIALGFVFYLSSQVGAAGVPYGLAKVIGGLVFSIGLSSVVVTGAELFTGSTMTLIPAAAGRLPVHRLLTNWGVVYAGNFIGALAITLLIYFGGTWHQAHGAWGLVALDASLAKVSHTFVESFCLGVLCNLLVCIAVWMNYAGRTATDKVVSVTMPVAAFVATGFEHSVANMFLIPLGILIKDTAGPGYWAEAGVAASHYADLTWGNFLVGNLLPVTLGNVVGGGVLVGLLLWRAFRPGPTSAG